MSGNYMFSIDTWNLDGGGTNGKRLWTDGVWFVKLAQLKNCGTWSAIPEVYDGSSERDGNIQAFQNCWKTSKVSWLFQIKCLYFSLAVHVYIATLKMQ